MLRGQAGDDVLCDAPDVLLVGRAGLAARGVHLVVAREQLLGRFGIDLIAEKIESEAMVVDLLDYDVRFGQGFLFSPPRPVRAEALQGVAERGDVIVRETGAADDAPPDTTARNGGEAPAANGAGNGVRTTGLAQLVPRFRSS